MNTQKPIGAAPATLIHVGDQMVDHVSLKVTRYFGDELCTKNYDKVEDLPTLHSDFNYWIDITGLHKASVIEKFCELYDFDKLAGEDVLNTNTSAKVEEFDASIFAVLKVPFMGEENETSIHQLSLLLKPNLLITFSEGEEGFFSPIYKRMLNFKGKLVNSSSDYLACAVMDLVTDQVLHILSNYEEELDNMEADLINDKTIPALSKVHGLRREIAKLQRAIRPQREVVNYFINSDSELLSPKTKPYFRDLYDHSLQVAELLDFLREHASSLRELYYTTTSHRMNETMKVMAGISVIFLPMSFLAGVYGMNFSNMPEYTYSWAYPVLLCVFLIIATTLFVIFKRRGWF